MLRLSGAIARSPLWFEKQNLMQASEFAWAAGELHIVARLAIAMGYLDSWSVGVSGLD